MSGQLLTIRYTCESCGLTDIPVLMPVREPDESVDAWMHQLVMRASIDHRMRNWDCRPPFLSQVKIPHDSSLGRVGDPPAS